MSDREKPKRQEKKIDADGLNRLANMEAAKLSSGMADALKALSISPDRRVPFYRMAFNRTTPKHPRDEFAEKSAKKKWRPWEILKIWAPAKNKEGKLFVPEQRDSRQQRRTRMRNEAYAYMKEHYGGEPRRIRRSMARGRMRNFLIASRGVV